MTDTEVLGAVGDHAAVDACGTRRARGRALVLSVEHLELLELELKLELDIKHCRMVARCGTAFEGQP